MTQTPTTSGVTGLVLEDRSGTRLLTITVPGAVGRLLTIAPVVVALLALHHLAPGTPWWPSVLVALLAVVAAELPDSGVGLFALGGLVAWWLTAVRDPTTGWAFLMACCGVVFHLALAHAAAGPPGCVPSRAVAARLAMRCGWLLLATGALALVVEGAEDWREPPTLVVGVTLALAGALPWLAARRTR